MPNMKTILIHIRKILVATLWAVIGVAMLLLDRATVGSLSRSIGTSLEMIGMQGLDKWLSMMVMPSGIVLEAVSAIRLGSLIVKLLSIMIVAIPLYLFFVVMPTVVYLAKAGCVHKTFCTCDTFVLQDVYLLQDKFLC